MIRKESYLKCPIMKKTTVQPGTKVAPERFYITIETNGPYMVYGHPPLAQEFIIPNEEGASWSFQKGTSYPTDKEPTALCRCGHSKNKPYCDGSHLKADWYPEMTAPEEPLLDAAEAFQGPEVSLTDNQSYCAFARFCDAKGRVWNLVGMDGKEARELTIREANYCPAGRLSAWDNETQQPFEPHYDPSLALIEDPAIHRSGPLWVRGGIPISREDGYTYEVRNRVTLCRCGESGNKPFCDGTHASFKFKDGLPGLDARKKE